MSQVISGIDDANFDVASWGWEIAKLVGLHHGYTVRSLLGEAAAILAGRHLLVLMLIVAGPATE